VTVGLAREADGCAAARIVAAFADELAEGLDLSASRVAARAKHVITEIWDGTA
jgi:hypothetical protein